MDYSHSEIEKKWQEHWRDIKLANCDVSLEKNNFYNLCMYPSFRITWLSVSCTNEFPDEAAIPLKALLRSSPYFLAIVQASPRDTRWTVAK